MYLRSKRGGSTDLREGILLDMKGICGRRVMANCPLFSVLSVSLSRLWLRQRRQATTGRKRAQRSEKGRPRGRKRRIKMEGSKLPPKKTL